MSSALPPIEGRFITFEGGEGSGKSFQLKALAQSLAAAGVRVTATREPGGAPGAERIRALLLDRATNSFDPLAETLLFWAARQDHLHVTIRPALASGKVVLCDRFVDSTIAYQGVAGHVPAKVLDDLRRIILGDDMPDTTIMLDIEPEIGLRRAAARRHGGEAPDRFEAESLAFHQSIRGAFLDIAQKDPGRCVMINADQPPDRVQHDVWLALSQRYQMPGDVS